jgi:2-polyprenyl-3-methyl-5-hydroxy-6-metoxy-1,4-benzoquinol methylase
MYGKKYYEGGESNYGSFGGYGSRLFGISRFLVTRKIFSIINKHKGGGRMVDLGCAYGYLVDSANRRGFDPMGVDVSGYAVNEARRRFPGLDIKRMDLDRGVDLDQASFDVVTAMDVLEHCRDPGQVLAGIREIMRDDAVLLVSVPDADIFPEERDLDKTHLWRISMKQWKEVFIRAGFDVEGTWVFPNLLKRVLPHWCVSLVLLRKSSGG